eukprot:5514726-Amphidinium_carterae.1
MKIKDNKRKLGRGLVGLHAFAQLYMWPCSLQQLRPQKERKQKKSDKVCRTNTNALEAGMSLLY